MVLMGILSFSHPKRKPDPPREVNFSKKKQNKKTLSHASEGITSDPSHKGGHAERKILVGPTVREICEL